MFGLILFGRDENVSKMDVDSVDNVDQMVDVDQ